MAFPPLIYDAAVTFELLAYSWPVGELVSIGEATIGEPDDGVLTQGKLYRLAVRVELPDADDDLLVERARRIARSTIDLFRQALSTYPLKLGSQYWIERRGKAGGTGVVSATASAVLRSDTLPANDLDAVRKVGAAFGKMNDARQRRSRAAVYWLHQSRTAPDAAQRVPAACFAIESAIGASGHDTAPAYIRAIESLGFTPVGPERNKMRERIDAILEMRTNVVHHGHLDKPSKEPKIEAWVRDLATAIVNEKLGLGAPAKLRILSDLNSS